MRAECDMALCAVADADVKSKVMNHMIQQRIPYSEEWHKVPLLQRKKFEKAKEVCVIVTHIEKADEARTLIRSLDEATRSRVYFDIKGLF